MAVYISNTSSDLQRWETACIMTSRYFILAKNNFMSDWKLLAAMNGNNISSYLFLSRKYKIKWEMHTQRVRNTYNIQGVHVIEVKGTAHLLFNWEIYHKITMLQQSVIAWEKLLLQNIVVFIAYSVTPSCTFMTGSGIWLKHYMIFDMHKTSDFLGRSSLEFGQITQNHPDSVTTLFFFLPWAENMKTCTLKNPMTKYKEMVFENRSRKTSQDSAFFLTETGFWVQHVYVHAFSLLTSLL